MSSTPSERRNEPAPGERTTSEPVDPARTSQFRPFGSSTPTTVTPVTRPAPATGAASAAEWEDPEDTGPERVRHIVDRFDGAAGLLILRLVTAVILGDPWAPDPPAPRRDPRPVRQARHAQPRHHGGRRRCRGLRQRLRCSSSARSSAWWGSASRSIAVGSLVYVKWRSGDFFTAGQPGFNGELELLLAGVGLAFAGPRRWRMGRRPALPAALSAGRPRIGFPRVTQGDRDAHPRGATGLTRPEVVSDRILTLPNVLSSLRLVGVPVFLWLLFNHHDVWAFVLLTAVGHQRLPRRQDRPPLRPGLPARPAARPPRRPALRPQHPHRPHHPRGHPALAARGPRRS